MTKFARMLLVGRSTNWRHPVAFAPFALPRQSYAILALSSPGSAMLTPFSRLTIPQIHPFMEAIRVNPADNLPRLVFADMLEENGETEYANYIRESVEQTIKYINQPEIIQRMVSFAKKTATAFTGRIVWNRGFITQIVANSTEYPAVHVLYPFAAFSHIRIPSPYHVPQQFHTPYPEQTGKLCVCQRFVPEDLWVEHAEDMREITDDRYLSVAPDLRRSIRKNMDTRLSRVLVKHARNRYLRSVAALV